MVNKNLARIWARPISKQLEYFQNGNEQTNKDIKYANKIIQQSKQKPRSKKK